MVRSAAQVEKYLRDFIEGTGEPWDWDDFECVPISDLFLEGIRQQAVMAGPPGPDMEKLSFLLEQVRAVQREV